MTFDTKSNFFYISCDFFFFLIIYVCQLSQKNSLFLRKKKFSRFINTHSTNNNVIRPVNRLQARVHSYSMWISASHPTHRGHQFFSIFFLTTVENWSNRVAREIIQENRAIKAQRRVYPGYPRLSARMHKTGAKVYAMWSAINCGR